MQGAQTYYFQDPCNFRNPLRGWLGRGAPEDDLTRAEGVLCRSQQDARIRPITPRPRPRPRPQLQPRLPGSRHRRPQMGERPQVLQVSLCLVSLNASPSPQTLKMPCSRIAVQSLSGFCTEKCFLKVDLCSSSCNRRPVKGRMNRAVKIYPPP